MKGCYKLAALKFEVGKLGIAKLANVPTILNNLKNNWIT